MYIESLCLSNLVFVCYSFFSATLRQFDFMLKGLQEVEQQCRSLSIPFTLLSGDPVDNISRYAVDCKAACVVVDFSPIRAPLSWVSAVASRLEVHAIPVAQVDAHNVVPCWIGGCANQIFTQFYPGEIIKRTFII